MTNPFLECPGYRGSDNRFNNALDAIIEMVDTLKQNDDSLRVSVYARDLNNGPWFGLNENDRFVSASLIKVPVMMMVLKQVENDVLSLDQEIVYDPSQLDPEREINFSSVESVAQMVAGESYTVEELLIRSVVYSSNEAYYVLLLLAPADERYEFERSVGVNWNEPMYPAETSVKNYSGFFRVLYNASYLNRELSEYALKILIETRFDFGLKAGTPEGTFVASKYGNQQGYLLDDVVLESRNNLFLSRETRFLHDCGIVYHPQGSYALCVMTRSAEQSNIFLAELIADISRIVYQSKSL